jgi:HEPN domain-containing protein
MVDREIIREWLSKAKEDFDFALMNLQEGKIFFPQICFHFQQSAEKYLKSFILNEKERFFLNSWTDPFSHNVFFAIIR